MATIREISDKAGVSIATVSKVLNNKGNVSEQTRKLILDTARELNYRPNLNARNLKAGHSNTIGVITEDLTVFNSPEIVDGIAATCDEAGYHYILENLRFYKRYGNGLREPVESNRLTLAAIDDLLSKQVDGIIYIGFHSHEVPAFTHYTDTRFVYAYCTCSDPQIPSVGYNEEKAAYRVTEMLVDHPDTVPGMISGPSDSIHTVNRLRGYQSALFDHRIPYNPAFTVTGDWGRDSGYTLGKQLIESGANAIFAQNDIMAMGVIDYCNEHNLTVGRDIRLIGFDDREIAQVSRPSLTTVSLPLFEIGRTSAEYMLNLLAAKPVPSGQTVLDCQIVKRESC